MAELFRQRCLNHAQREAVARCPDCKQFFCRECVTEHGDRLLCAACLRKLAGKPAAKRAAAVHVIRLAQCLAAILVAWFLFFIVGETLLQLPDAFHEQTLWRSSWFESE